ncbi:MAG: hypothetical protein HY238_12035, partial [Acidobacteria bacterium]|nr:hypothetical protein [Acidobacteriota bacterium]
MQSDRVRVALDTSVLVPLFSVWHGFHEATVREYERLRRERVQFVVPTHALLECFSVLTRLPGDYRMPSDEAKQLLEENFSTD